MTRYEWLASLKVGDEVGITDRYTKLLSLISKVTGITKTLIETDCDNRKFRIRDGVEFKGKEWWASSIIPVTDDHLREIEERNLSDKIIGSILDGLVDLKKLRRINEIIEEEDDESQDQEAR